MNAAYRHLESKTRIAELTLGQWAGIVLGVLVAVAFAVVLKPFSGYVNFAVGIYIGGLPAAAVFLASISEVDFWLLGRSAMRFHRADGRYLPGPGQRARGYTIHTAARATDGGGRLDLGALWDTPHATTQQEDNGQHNHGREPDGLAGLLWHSDNHSDKEQTPWQ
jgi:hypothetical protein